MININTTKTTIPVLKIALCYNNEKDFFILQKIINFFRWSSINVTFEIFEIGEKNFQKGLPYGISQDDLVRLKTTNFLIHTPFSQNRIIPNIENKILQYLNFAMHNFITYSFNKNINLNFVYETEYFNQHKQYVKNEKEIFNNLNNLHIKTSNVICEFEKNLIALHSLGSNYSIFSLYDLSDYGILFLLKKIMKYISINTYTTILNDAIKHGSFEELMSVLKKQETKQPICSSNVNLLSPIIYNKEIDYLDQEIKQDIFSLNGLFNVKQIVSTIKDGLVKIPDELELNQIFIQLDNLQQKIEVYPNIAFWEDIVVNPTIYFIKKQNC